MSNHKYCDQCGQSINRESKFCASCGNEIKKITIEKKSDMEMSKDTEIKIKSEEILDKNVVIKNSNLKGIDGWLWLPVIGLWCYLFINIIDLFIALKSLNFLGIIINLMYVSVQVYLLLLIKKRDYRFPKYFIYFSIATILINLLSAFIIFSTGGSSKIETWYSQTKDVYQELFRGIFFGVIWIWYFKVSERVRLTFVNSQNGEIKRTPKLELFCTTCNLTYNTEDKKCPQCDNKINEEVNGRDEIDDFKLGDFKSIIIVVVAVVVIFLLIAKFSFSDDKVLSEDNKAFNMSESNDLDIKGLSGAIASVTKNDGTVNEKGVSCDKSRGEFQATLDNNKREAEKVGVYRNISTIKETFYSNKINTCVAVVEILNDYQSPPERRMYAYDTLNNKDLFSTGSYYCNYESSCSNPAYSVEKNNFYDKVGNLGGTVLKENIPRLTSIIKKNTITVINNVYGTIETFEINYQDGSVTRNEIPGFVYNQDRVKKY